MSSGFHPESATHLLSACFKCRGVKPALEKGQDVVSDRFIGSSLAYQGAGRVLGVSEVEAVSLFATDGLQADLNIFIDVDEATAQERLNRSLDRIELAGKDFHSQVAEAYRKIATNDPEHWVVINGNATVDEVTEEIMVAINQRL